MSIATSANARAVFGDMLTPQQKVATSMPSAAAIQKFADFLAEKQSTPATSLGAAPTPEQLAKGLLAEAYDSASGSVQTEKLAATVQKRSAEFADRFRQELSKHGIDPNSAIELSVGAEGRIIVESSHPDAAAIGKLLEDDPDLAQAFRSIAAQNDHMSKLQAGAAYVKEWDAAKNDGERQALWSRYSTLMDRLSNTFGGRMTFGPATAVAESQQMVRRMGIS